MSRRIASLPIVLLVLMTISTFCGPIAFGLVLRGGASPDWPPDRAIEWWALGLITALVLGLMVAAISTSVILERKAKRARLRGSQERSPEGSHAASERSGS